MQTSHAGGPALSIVIPNYNYGDYVGQAIESALAVDWPQVQVIVVDDGSTDHSRTVIERYAGRVDIVHQANAGQLQAYNVGFARSTAPVVIFLDSDDLLDAGVMRAVAAVWRPGISKVQWRVRSIDAAGRPLGHAIPQFAGVPTPQQIRDWAATTTAYPTPPGSGNAYARSYLQQIFPLDDACGRPGDAPCLAAAPFLGDVLTLPQVLSSYRLHGRNDGAASGLDVEQFRLHVERALQRHAYAQRIARRVGIAIDDAAIDRSLSYLPYRLASLQLAPGRHPRPGDSGLRVLADVLRALPRPQGMALRGKLAVALWACLVVLAPDALGRRLILWRFAPSTRPRALRSTLAALRLVRG